MSLIWNDYDKNVLTTSFQDLTTITASTTKSLRSLIIVNEGTTDATVSVTKNNAANTRLSIIIPDTIIHPDDFFILDTFVTLSTDNKLRIISTSTTVTACATVMEET